MNLESKLEFTRVRYLALSFSSFYLKLCLVSSALGHPGSCCIQMTVISAETEEWLKMKLNKWKTEMEAKGLRVNMGKTKIMVSGVNLQTLKDSGKYPCSVCRKGVGSNSIYCAGCTHCVHKKCSGVIGSLKSNPDYRCSRCKGTARPIDGRPHNEWLLVQDKKLDVVDSFCYLGDTIGAGGSCDLSIITRIRSA